MLFLSYVLGGKSNIASSAMGNDRNGGAKGMAFDIKGDKVVLSRGSFAEEDFSYYGRLKGERASSCHSSKLASWIERDRLELGVSLKEFMKRASGKQPYFDLKYVVYKDLRERGLLRATKRDGLPALSARRTARRGLRLLLMSTCFQERIPVPLC